MLIFDKDLWQEIYSSLSQNKLRTFLTAFGVFWGTFMLLTMLGSTKGLTNGANAEWSDFAVNSAFMNTQQTSMAYGGYDRGRWFSMNNDDVDMIKKAFPELQVVTGGVWYNGSENQGNIVVYKKEVGSFVLLGESPDRFKIAPLKIMQGRILNWDDFDQKRKVIMIGKNVAESLFKKGEEPLGKYIQVNDVYFLVIGIFESKHSGGWADWENRQMFMPRTTAQRAFNLGDQVSWMTLNAPDNIPVTDLVNKVRLKIAKKYKIHPDDEMAFRINDISEEFRQVQGLFLGISFLTWIIGGFTLLAGVIGIGNIMLITVKERTKEIGVRRAVGAKPWQVVSQIMLESAILTIAAGYFGLLLGIGAVELLDVITQGGDATFKNPQISFDLAIGSLAILFVSGLVAGTMPAVTALNVKPIEALRD